MAQSSTNTLGQETGFARNTLMVMIANAVGGIGLLIANVILARIFSVDDYGIYKTISYFFIFFFGMTDLGINLTIIRHISQFVGEGSQEKTNHLLRYMIRIKLISHGAFILLVIAAARPLSQLLVHTNDHAVLIMLGSTIVLFSFFETSKIVSLGFHRYREFSWSTLLTFLCSGVFTLLGGYLAGVGGAIFGFALGYFFGNLPSTIFVIRSGLLTQNHVLIDAKSIFKKYALPIFLTVIPNSLSNAYIPLLSLFFSRTLIAYYGLTITFYSGIYLLTQALYQMMLARSAAVGSDRTSQRHLLRRTFIFYGFTAIVGIAGVLLFSRPLISGVNQAYLDGVTIFRGFLITALILGFFVVLSGYWSGLGKIKKAIGSLVIYNILLFGVSYFLLAISR